MARLAGRFVLPAGRGASPRSRGVDRAAMITSIDAPPRAEARRDKPDGVQSRAPERSRRVERDVEPQTNLLEQLHSTPQSGMSLGLPLQQR